MNRLKTTQWLGIAILFLLEILFLCLFAFEMSNELGLVSLFMAIVVFAFGAYSTWSWTLGKRTHNVPGSFGDPPNLPKDQKARRKEAGRTLERLYKEYAAGRIDKDQLKSGLDPYKQDLIEMGLVKEKQ